MGKIDYQAIYDKNRHDWFAMTEEPQKYEALLAGHYSDSNHFLYELLQNAEDEKATKVAIEYYDDRLVFYHDGKPFDENDVRGVSSMLMGTKNKDDASTIGKFGMGFKSVFKYTCQPEIYSDEEGFLIQNYLLPKEVSNGWDYQKAKAELHYPDGQGQEYAFARCEHLTKIVIPFQKIDAAGTLTPVSGKHVLEKLKELSGEILLFLSHIQDLYWIAQDTGEFTHIALRKNEMDGHLITCHISGNSEEKREDTSRYLQYKDIFDHPEMRNAEVSVAYRLNSQGKNVNEISDSPVWVYFPTKDDTALPFIIHGSFETAVSREKLMTPSDFNNDLFERLGALIANSMEDLKRRGLITQNFIRHVILPAFQDEKYGALLGLKEKITGVFRSKAMVPDANGHNRLASELRIPVPFSLADQASSGLWVDTFADIGEFAALNAERDTKFTEYFLWLRDDLGIPVFTLKDWAKKLYEQPERKISSTDGTMSELRAFYDLISRYKEKDFQYGPYYAEIRDSLSDAWEYLKKAPIVLNAENQMVSAYKDNVPQVYLSASSKYKTVPNSRIVNDCIAADYYPLLSEGLKIAEFDNYQFVKEKVIWKYVEGNNGRTGFEDPDNFDQEYRQDLEQIFTLFEEMGDAEKVRKMLNEAYIIKIKTDKNTAIFAKPNLVYTDHSDEGIDLLVYYRVTDENENVTDTDGGRVTGVGMHQIDTQYYEERGISIDQLKRFGLRTTPIQEGIRKGRGVGDEYWDAIGDFCPWLSIDRLGNNLDFIEKRADSDLAKKKSAEILKLLLLISHKLEGTRRYRKQKPYTKEENAWILGSIRQHCWLFDKTGNLNQPGNLSRYDLNAEIYNNLPNNKKGFQIIGFAEKESDVKAEAFERVQALSPVDKKIMFRQLAKEFGYDLELLHQASVQKEVFYGEHGEENEVFDPNAWRSDEFPQHRVRNLKSLLAHVQQQFFSADPIKYEKVLRQIRTSQHKSANEEYVKEMYSNESNIRICQMCKTPAKYITVVEIANFGIEMAQLHLLLCQDCARSYQGLRDAAKDRFRDEMRKAIGQLNAEEPEGEYSASCGTAW